MRRAVGRSIKTFDPKDCTQECLGELVRLQTTCKSVEAEWAEGLIEELVEELEDVQEVCEEEDSDLNASPLFGPSLPCVSVFWGLVSLRLLST